MITIVINRTQLIHQWYLLSWLVPIHISTSCVLFSNINFQHFGNSKHKRQNSSNDFRNGHQEIYCVCIAHKISMKTKYKTRFLHSICLFVHFYRHSIHVRWLCVWKSDIGFCLILTNNSGIFHENFSIHSFNNLNC